MHQKPQVVLINYTLNFGGAERYISHLANFLSKNEIKVYIVLLDNSPVQYELDNNIIVIQPIKSRPREKFKKLLYFIYIFKFIRTSLNSIKPQLIINTAFPTFILAAIGKKHPVYLSIRCDPKNTSLIEGLKIPIIIRKFFYKRAKGIIAQTEYAKTIISEQFRHNNIITIPNFLSDFKYLKTERANEVLCVGRLVKSKGHAYLIKAFSEVENKEWKLVIVGDGPQKVNLERLTNSLGLNNRVLFTGSKTDVYAYYQHAKIFAFPSLTEGFPNVLLEAMASGLACISFDCLSGPSEVIKDGENGFLVKPGDIKMLADSLNLVIKDGKLRDKLGRAAIQVREKYNIENIGKEYLNIISKYSNET